MGNKVNKVCSLDYNPLVSRSRVPERRASPQMRARARGVFPLKYRETLSLRRPPEARLGQVVVWN